MYFYGEQLKEFYTANFLYAKMAVQSRFSQFDCLKRFFLTKFNRPRLQKGRKVPAIDYAQKFFYNAIKGYLDL